MTIPKNETLWVRYLDLSGAVTHIITSDKHRDTYKLYKIVDNKPVYTKHKSDNPLDLDKFRKEVE